MCSMLHNVNLNGAPNPKATENPLKMARTAARILARTKISYFWWLNSAGMSVNVLSAIGFRRSTESSE